MQNIDLIAIGKMNAAYFAQGVAEYQKRLGGFCNFRIIELPEVQIADKNASDKQIAKALQKEGEAILASVRKGAYLVALCVEGRQVSSEDLAAMIADRAMSGAGDMASEPSGIIRVRDTSPTIFAPGRCPPMPGFAPCPILISIAAPALRYSSCTPKRPDATCTIVFSP